MNSAEAEEKEIIQAIHQKAQTDLAVVREKIVSDVDNVRASLQQEIGEFAQSISQKILGRPIVTGASRKSFIGHVTGGSPQERVEGTAASVTAAILNGCRVIRVHDVKTMKKVAAMADALAGA